MKPALSYYLLPPLQNFHNHITACIELERILCHAGQSSSPFCILNSTSRAVNSLKAKKHFEDISLSITQ